MCGSGTLLVEAALLARRIAPGLGRGFGFERWPALDETLRQAWRTIRDEAKASALPRAPAPILGRDRSEEAVETARRNAKRASVQGDLMLSVADARDLEGLPAHCQIFTNPPYGERLGKRRLQLEGLYRQLGERWLNEPKVARVVVLSGNPALARLFPGRPTMDHTLYNGPLACRLLAFSPKA
jgi:23S rRNA G2445 N2-methylase RlmL